MYDNISSTPVHSQLGQWKKMAIKKTRPHAASEKKEVHFFCNWGGGGGGAYFQSVIIYGSRKLSQLGLIWNNWNYLLFAHKIFFVEVEGRLPKLKNLYVQLRQVFNYTDLWEF